MISKKEVDTMMDNLCSVFYRRNDFCVDKDCEKCPLNKYDTGEYQEILDSINVRIDESYPNQPIIKSNNISNSKIIIN